MTRMQLLFLSHSRAFLRAWSLSAGLRETWKKELATKPQTPQVPANIHEIEKIVKQVSCRSGCLIFVCFFFYLDQIFPGSQMCGSVDVPIKAEFFFTATNNAETSHINSSTLTRIASDFCWQGFHCWLGDNKAVHWEPRPNNCIVHVQALSWGQPEYYLELLPSCCPLLLCLYGELLIVWQDWQAPLQSWLKALRSEKWDRYRANTCPLAVSESPTGCALHWHRINGSIKKPT